MIDIEFSQLIRPIGVEIGFWLDEHMPNPPMPDEQRWTLGESSDGRTGITFADEKDATHFLLRWS